MLKHGIFATSEPIEPRTWRDLLADASAPEQVLRVAKDYLATWHPFELAALPAECKPPEYVVAPEDIVNYAFTLVQYQCGPNAGNEDADRLANFFSQAAQRVAILMSRAPQPAAPNEPHELPQAPGARVQHGSIL